MNKNQELILKTLKEDLAKLHDKQQYSSEIEYAKYDFMQLHKIVELIEFLDRMAKEADSHMNFTKRQHHQLQFAYMDLQLENEKLEEMIEEEREQTWWKKLKRKWSSLISKYD